MRITRITLGGFKAFPAPVTLPLAALPGTITAVSGANGAGKTTLCTLGVLGALYRDGGEQSPNAMASARDAHVEVDVQVGRDLLRIRQIFDGQKGGGKALVTDLATATPSKPSGEPVDSCKSGGIKEYMAWAAKALPALDVVTASTYLGQGAGGLLKMSDAERASLVLRALGSDRLERLAEATRKRAGAAAEALAVIVARLADERERGGDAAATGAALEAARAAQGEAAVAVREAEEAVQLAAAHAMAAARHGEALRRVAALHGQWAGARATVAEGPAIQRDAARVAALDVEVDEHGRALADATRERDAARAAADSAAAAARRAMDRIDAARARYAARGRELEAERRDVAKRRDDAQTRLTNNRKVVADAPAIRAAAARLAVLDAEMAAARAEKMRLEGSATTAAQRADDAGRRELDTLGHAAQATRRAEGVRVRLDVQETVEAAVRDLPAARETLAVATAAEGAAAARCEALRTQMAGQWEQRHGALLFVLERIAADANPTGEDTTIAAKAVSADANAAVEAAGLPAAIAAADAERVAAGRDVAAAASRALWLERMAARAEQVAADRVELQEHEAAAAASREEAAAARAAIEAARADEQATRAAIEAVYATLRALADERPAVEARARHAKQLDVAEERIADLEHATATDSEALVRLDAALALLPAQEASETATDCEETAALGREAAQHRARAEAAAYEVTGLTSALQVAQRARAALGDVAGRVAALARAEAAAEALAGQLEAARAEALETEAALPAAPVDEAQAEAELAAAREAERGAAAAMTRAEEAHARAEEAAGRVAALAAERRATEQRLADLRTLAEDLGRRGIQADLVDGAAPMLTSLTNELLRSAGVMRWTVRFASSKTRKDGAEVPAFPLLVRDEVTGEERDARTFSGGEKVLIDAGACNAVAVLACQRAGIEGPVLVRDETGAALDATNERAWMGMLRRMVDMTGASRAIVCTHSASLRAMCDSVVWVGGGEVRTYDAGSYGDVYASP